MKVVINKRHGGFSVSKKVYDYLGVEYDGYGYISNENFGIKSEDYQAYRTEPRLIEAIEKVGIEEAGGNFASLKIVEIPDDIEYYIDDYDGYETIHEAHRSW